MKYRINEERIGDPTYKVDEESDELINFLANILDMDKGKIKFFTGKIGLAWLDEPSVIGATEEQKNKINDFKTVLRRISI